MENDEMPDTSVRSDVCLLPADLEELKACLEKTGLRYARQQERLERLQQTLNNTREDMLALKMILHYVNIYHCIGRCRSSITYKDISRFFIRASKVYDKLEHRFHCHINYRYFCMGIHLCYHLESRVRRKGHGGLSFLTILSYFKRERGG